MKKTNDEWPDDPVVREVRRRLWKEAGGTMKGLRRLLDRKTLTLNRRRKKSGRALTRPGKPSYNLTTRVPQQQSRGCAKSDRPSALIAI